MSKRGGGSGGGSAHIEVFGRIRPSKRPSHYLEVDYADHAITLSIPKSEGGLINNQKERWAFPFSRVLDASTNQETVFEVVARPVIDSVLEGYNGTIFAYGQTGSGKTYTITGGAERYVDRGIIPRAIAYVFQRIGERPDFIFEVRISYLEIYQNSGYDLLDEKHDTKAIEDLPKVSLLEDEEGKTHLRNLSSQLARSEEEALNLLFVGDTNRMISETPMNLASSRSHCIFTVSIDARRPDSEVVRRSKLHLVDLAGSERIKKTGIEGKMLNEAKYINVSLHFLEQVIVALQEKQKFVPYRNSMMTQCLRDSLGGNCRTVMVATLAPEEELIDETISTCRFAQRVALISNRLEINEEVDPKRLIARLKAQVRELKEELQVLRGEGYERLAEALSTEERERCELLVREYLAAPDDAILTPGELAKVQYCFRILKQRGGAAVAEPAGGASAEELDRLRMQLQQRDHEIGILVSMLNAGGANQGGATTGGGAAVACREVGNPGGGAGGAAGERATLGGGAARVGEAGPARAVQLSLPPAEVVAARQKEKQNEVRAKVAAAGAEGTDEAEMLIARNAAFESFRRSYRKNQVIEDNKRELKDKYDKAKALGESVNQARARINGLKAQVEAVRRSRAAVELMDGGSAYVGSEEEAALRGQMEGEKRTYKEGFAKLKEYKAEIEHLQLMLEQSRRRLQQDFENWWVTQQQPEEEPASPPRRPRAGAAGSPRTAGRPPLTGNPEVDAEILAFYQAREGLVAQRMGKPP